MSGAASRPFWTRPSALFLAAFLLALMAWLGWQVGRAMTQPEVTARPALWHISLGNRHAYLFGTIHAVPRGEAWLSPEIDRAVNRSDRLILEVTGLDAERRSRTVFEHLGRSRNLPPIEARLGAPDAKQYIAIKSRHASTLNDLDAYESWAAALLLNAATSSDLSLSPSEAGEAIFSARFTEANKPISGLETIDGQLGLFDTLSERDQRALLTQAIHEAGETSRLYAQLHAAWTHGDIARLERQFLSPFARTPGLRRTLIDNRNRRWASLIDADLRRHDGTAFIAVGAGHLLGRDSLQARMAERGWRIKRIQ